MDSAACPVIFAEDGAITFWIVVFFLHRGESLVSVV